MANYKDLPFYLTIVPHSIHPLVEWQSKFHLILGTKIDYIYGSFTLEATTLFRVKHCQHNERVKTVIPV